MTLSVVCVLNCICEFLENEIAHLICMRRQFQGAIGVRSLCDCFLIVSVSCKIISYTQYNVAFKTCIIML